MVWTPSMFQWRFGYNLQHVGDKSQVLCNHMTCLQITAALSNIVQFSFYTYIFQLVHVQNTTP